MTTTAESVRTAFKYLFKDELLELKSLAIDLPENPVVVNIGAGSGTSGLAFIETRPDITLYTIDIQDGSSPFGCLHAERDVFKKAGFPRGKQNWVQLLGDSKSVNWPYGYVDLVFIDGDHSYDGCMGDIKTWLPRIKPGGVMAIHDYQKDAVFHGKLLPDAPHFRAWEGVDKAVAEFIKSGKYGGFYVVDTLAVFTELG